MAVGVWPNLIIFGKEVQRGQEGIDDFDSALEGIFIGPPALAFFAFGEVIVIYEDLPVKLEMFPEISSAKDAEEAIVGAPEVLLYGAVEDNGDEVGEFHTPATRRCPGAVHDGLVKAEAKASRGSPEELVNGSVFTGVVSPGIGLIGDKIYKLGEEVVIFPSA
jgi:hypothetical protein